MATISFIYLFSLVSWLGSILFFSFILAPTAFKNFSPDMAGQVVAAVFTKYYTIGTIAGFVALACLFLNGWKSGTWSVLKIALILFMLTINIYSELMAYPRAHSLKEELKQETDAAEILVLQKEFKRAHRISMINNGIVLVLGLVLLGVTSKGLEL